MNADWEHFLNTVDSRYGLQEPVIKETEEPEALSQEELPKIPEIPASRTVSRKSGNLRRVLAIAAGLALLIVLGFGVWMAMDQFGTRVPENVSVAGVEIGGMKKSQAVKTVKTTLGEPYAARDLVITLPNGELRFSPKETGVTLNADALVADACKQTGVLELQPYLSLNETALRSMLSEYARQLSEQFTPSSYALKGNIPALDEENFDESAPCPKLVLNPGTSGFALDVDNLWNLIQQAYADSSFSVDAQSVVSSLDPDPLDLQTIQEQLGIAPVNARMDTVTHKAVPGSYGLDFDRDEAEKQLRKLQTGEQLEMELHYAAPEIIGQEVY